MTGDFSEAATFIPQKLPQFGAFHLGFEVAKILTKICLSLEYVPLLWVAKILTKILPQFGMFHLGFEIAKILPQFGMFPCYGVAKILTKILPQFGVLDLPLT